MSDKTCPIDHAFSDTVKALQSARGSRQTYAAMAERDAWSSVMDEGVQSFIAEQNSIYLGTVSAEGQPYIQHRGGPPGFVRVMDERTIAFADFRGNRQFISQGNLSDNPRAFLFLMDYANTRRLKLWGHAEVTDDEGLVADLMPAGYNARATEAIVFHVELWDYNCRAHIPKRYDASDVSAAVGLRDAEIAQLRARIAHLEERLNNSP